MAASSAGCCKPKEIAVPVEPTACLVDEPPTPPDIRDTDCGHALCYDRENATALWLYLEDMIQWANRAYEACKETPHG